MSAAEKIQDANAGPRVGSNAHADPEKVDDTTAADTTNTETDEEAAAVPPQTTPHAAQELQRWNESPQNILRFLSTIYYFILIGMSDGVLGALLPYVRICLFSPSPPLFGGGFFWFIFGGGWVQHPPAHSLTFRPDSLD